MNRSAGWRAAVESNSVDGDATGWLGLRWLRWVDNSYSSSTTALGVLDSATTSLAGRGLLASLSTWHFIMELKVAVELNINIHVRDGEILDTLA